MMDQDVMSQLIGRIYDATLPGADWADLLNDIADFACAETVWMVLCAPKIGLSTVIAPRSDPEIIADYQRHWWSRDPTLAATGTAPVGRVTSLEDTGRARFLSSEFHNDFWQRSGHSAERLAANLISDPGAVASIGIQPYRQAGRIEPEISRTFSALVPHVVRAVEIRSTLREIEMARDLARTTPRKGALLVDRNGHLIVADDKAESIVRTNDRIVIDGGEIAIRPGTENDQLRRLIASCHTNCVKGGRLDVRNEEGVGLSIEVLPFSGPKIHPGPEVLRCPQPGALLILSEPIRERCTLATRLKDEFGLTQAEALVTLELMRSDGRAAVAERLGVTLATVRTHMMRIFEKLEVNNQTALVSSMLRIGIDADRL